MRKQLIQLQGNTTVKSPKHASQTTTYVNLFTLY